MASARWSPNSPTSRSWSTTSASSSRNPSSRFLDADWFRFFEVNVLSGVRLSRHYLPRMNEHGWGRIVFISSESALQIPEEMIHYGMTKTAQLAISRGLAETTAGTNVTVNTVLPGPTDSEGVETFVEQMAAAQKTSRGGSGERILPQRAPFVAAEALRARRRSGRLSGFRLQSIVVGHQRRRSASGWRGGAGDRVSTQAGWKIAIPLPASATPIHSASDTAATSLALPRGAGGSARVTFR